MTVVINERLCKGCGICAEKCPWKAITMSEGKPIINKNECSECGTCVEACPNVAIHF